MMRRVSLPLLVVVVVVVANYAVVTSAENAVEKKDNPESPRVLKTDEKRSIPLGEEERGVANLASRLKNLLRRRPTKVTDAQNNIEGANDAIRNVNKIIGPGKASTELTPAKMKALEAYAKSNSDNWWAMAYFITNVLGIGLAVWFVYGTLFLGWRPYGMGGSPRAN
ncbi:hypothetical protein P3T76_011740 [Phytophthora citrophthora]|uniref:RxLR effector protein n=1 Tax=Phytophthora citrophthora TaxID=4793 RepID=A0AAD9LEY1_9STRA|nr:hypothetical protein P3T76_011740 [Phytophthora citrophthora]